MESRADPVKARHLEPSSKAIKKGISIERKHSQAGLPPLDQVIYERRTSKISNPDGSPVFEAKDAEVPASWSQLASDILISKYFRRSGVSKTGAETSVKQVISRIARSIRQHGEVEGYFASAQDASAFEDELTYLLVNQRGAFNSPVWFTSK